MKVWENFESELDQLKVAAESEEQMEVDQLGPTHILNTSKYQTADDLFEVYIKATMSECEKIFSSEEGNGKYLDLTSHFSSFLGIKGLDHLKDGKTLPHDYLSWLN